MACGESTPDFDIYAWPEGKWRLEMDDGDYQMEIWKRMNDELLIGQRILIENDSRDSSFLEEMRVHKKVEGTEFVPLTSSEDGQEVVYTLRKVNGTEFTFENKEHDFPKRIIYNYKGKDILQARIEGQQDGQARSQSFLYERQ